MNANVTIDSLAIAIVNKTSKLDPQFIKANGLTKDEVKELRTAVAELRNAKRREAFLAKGSKVVYRGNEMTFAPKRIEGTNIIVFTTIDKNAVTYVKAGKDGLVYGAIPCCSKKAKEYELRKAEVSANVNKTTTLLKEVTVGMTIEEFISICEGYTTYKVVKATGVLKTLAD